MEYERHAPCEQPVNVLDILKTDRVRSLIKLANDNLQSSRFSPGNVGEFVRKYQHAIEAALGRDYTEGEATVTGTAYLAGTTEQPDVMFFENKKLIFCGTSVQTIDSGPEVVFEFFEEVEDGDDTDPIETIYYMLPDDIDKLEITPTETLCGILSHHANQSRRLLAYDGFFDAPTRVQHEILSMIITHFNSDTKAYIGEEHLVQATRYMSVYDDMPMSLSDSYFDQTTLDPSDRFAPHGTYTGSVFAERCDQPSDGFNSIDQFKLSRGTPCMLLRDDARRATYVVPIDAITEADVIEDFTQT